MWFCHLMGRRGHDALEVLEMQGVEEGGTRQGMIFSLWNSSYAISGTPYSKSKEHHWYFVSVLVRKHLLGAYYMQGIGLDSWPCRGDKSTQCIVVNDTIGLITGCMWALAHQIPWPLNSAQPHGHSFNHSFGNLNPWTLVASFVIWR